MKNALLLSILLVLLLPACAPAGSGAASAPSPREEKEAGRLEFAGRVTYVPVEGGFFGIIAADGTRYDPVNLPQAFRRDGLPVRVEARRLEGVIGFHMWGIVIEILAIEKT